MRRVTGITGGIGSGKSTVSRLLRLKGYTVYDCDYEARRLTDSDRDFSKALQERFGADILDAEGRPLRKDLARIVFADPEALEWLNGKVHGMVRRHLAAALAGADAPQFVESAILAGAGLTTICDEIWVVEAPEDVRITRVCRRSGMTPEEVRERMDSQRAETDMLRACGLPLRMIINDGFIPLLPQIEAISATAGKD